MKTGRKRQLPGLVAWWGREERVWASVRKADGIMLGRGEHVWSLEEMGEGSVGGDETYSVMTVINNVCVYTLCESMDCSPPGSSVHGILQARILEWVAISSTRDPPYPGIEPASPALAGRSFTTEPPWKLLWTGYLPLIFGFSSVQLLSHVRLFAAPVSKLCL